MSPIPYNVPNFVLKSCNPVQTLQLHGTITMVAWQHFNGWQQKACSARGMTYRELGLSHQWLQFTNSRQHEQCCASVLCTAASKIHMQALPLSLSLSMLHPLPLHKLETKEVARKLSGSHVQLSASQFDHKWQWCAKTVHMIKARIRLA